MAENGTPARYCCCSCGAPLEVRVGFRGRLVWTVESDNPVFAEAEPELRGEHQDPQLVCSADVMHKTGFRLHEGAVAADSDG